MIIENAPPVMPPARTPTKPLRKAALMWREQDGMRQTAIDAAVEARSFCGNGTHRTVELTWT
jgi:hypothetical protein